MVTLCNLVVLVQLLETLLSRMTEADCEVGVVDSTLQVGLHLEVQREDKQDVWGARLQELKSNFRKWLATM